MLGREAKLVLNSVLLGVGLMWVAWILLPAMASIYPYTHVVNLQEQNDCMKTIIQEKEEEIKKKQYIIALYEHTYVLDKESSLQLLREAKKDLKEFNINIKGIVELEDE
jgi:hypothetical protein